MGCVFDRLIENYTAIFECSHPMSGSALDGLGVAILKPGDSNSPEIPRH
jgi:hypothetical protein